MSNDAQTVRRGDRARGGRVDAMGGTADVHLWRRSRARDRSRDDVGDVRGADEAGAGDGGGGV